MLKFMTDSRNLCCAGGYVLRDFTGRSFRQKIILILLIIFSSFSSYSIAGMQIKQDISRMVQRSDLIIRGKVISTESQWKEDSRGRHIYTSVTVKILDKIKGNIKDGAFAFEVVGGIVDDIREVVSNTPAFEVDEDAIVFLAEHPRTSQQVTNGKILIYDGRVYWDDSEVTADSFIRALKILKKAPGATISLGEKYQAPTAEAADVPIITNITSDEALAVTNKQVTITGTNFGSTQGFSKVKFFNKSRQQKIPASIVSWSNTQIICTVPANISAGSSPVTVTTSDGTSSSYDFEAADCFIYDGYKWPGTSPVVSYKINQNTSDCIGEGAAVQRAADTWNNVGANFTFQYGGSSYCTVSSYDGTNCIFWDGYYLPYYVVAQNSLWHYEGSKVILECDVEFNDWDYTWSTDPYPSSWEWDVESVALHEFGHWLNLGDLYDICCEDVVMYYERSSGFVKRVLHPCDCGGICYIYGGCPPCCITVTSPTCTGSSNWATGTPHTIMWNSSDNPGSYVKIQLYKGSSLVQTITSSTYDGGLYSWTPSTSLADGSDYRIKVSATTYSFCYDYSSYFTIHTPSQDDAYEENDTCQTAYDLSNYEQTWLSNIDGLGIQADDDWYQINVTSGYERVLIDCRFTDADGDIDICLYDSSCSQLACSASTTDNEYIEYTVSGGGTYYIKVYYDDAGNTYDLWWDDVLPPDITPPSPNPMTWATEPYAISTSSIRMVATTATDPTTPILYYFDFVSSPTGGAGGTDSGWQSSPVYTDSGLSVNHQYWYKVKAKDGNNNQTSYSPSKDAYTYIEASVGVSFGTVTSNSIEVKSSNTPSNLSSGDSGLLIWNLTAGTNSGWQQNNDFWVSSGLIANMEYEFTAQSRNGDATQTPDSPMGYRYTRANSPGAASFSNVTQTSIQANWAANGNSSGTQYLCENTIEDTNSGWTSNIYWNESGLSCNTQYCYQVRAKNGDGVETSPTSLGCQSTLPCPHFMISASAGLNGTVEPNGVFDVNPGEDVIFTAELNTGYTVDQWYLDGNSVQQGNTSYTLYNVQADHNVLVTFIEIPPMDLNNDGILNFSDFAIFAFYWMDNTCSDPDWCEGSDSDYSGRVDFVDLLNFVDYWLWCRADLDIDGDVDFADYAVFANHWTNQNCAEADWCSGADLNKSGSVDLYDLGKFADNWLAGM